jgi:DNA-binding PadR family transcriptional regulator
VNIDLAILNVLSATPRALPVATIARETEEYLHREPSHMDVNVALRRLQAKGLVKGTEKPLVGTVWIATEEGKLAI